MNSILGISVIPETKLQKMRKILTYLHEKKFAHIVSLNPEIVMTAQESSRLKKILNEAEIKLIDGIGLVIAGKILNIPVGERVTGVELMTELIGAADENKLHILIIGAFNSTANDLAEQLSMKYQNTKIRGIKGYTDIKHPSTIEEKEIQKILREFKPDIIFVAFGAPPQEFWVEDHKQFLKNSVCMSVGGAVDFLAGKVPRAPRILQKIGLEWLFRLVIQPWRWRRQLKLITFLKLVIQQKNAN